MLHSGSRNVGKTIADVFITKAKEEMHQKGIKLKDRELAYLQEGNETFQDYCNAVSWAQQYAYLNREAMMHNIITTLLNFFPDLKVVNEAVNCHHNYVEFLDNNIYLTRKGAISARKGQLGIIPGSMGTNSYIVRGLGSENSFNSASHGAGRKMSRSQAKRIFGEQDATQQLGTVECRRDRGVYDELPGAYKEIGQVMEDQKDLVEPVRKLKQVLCVKG